MEDIRQIVKHVIVRADRERSVLIGQENVYQVGYGAVLVLCGNVAREEKAALLELRLEPLDTVHFRC